MHETNSPLIRGEVQLFIGGAPVTDIGRIWFKRPRPHILPRSKQGIIMKPRRWARARRHRRKKKGARSW